MSNRAHDGINLLLLSRLAWGIVKDSYKYYSLQALPVNNS